MDGEINYWGKHLLFSIIWRKFIFLLFNIIFCIFQEFMSVCKNLSAKQVCSIRSCLCLSSIIFILRWMMRSQNSTLAEMKSNDGDILSCQFFNTTTSTILLPIIPSPKLRLELLKLLLLMKWTTSLSGGSSAYISIKENQQHTTVRTSKCFLNISEIFWKLFSFITSLIGPFIVLISYFISPSLLPSVSMLVRTFEIRYCFFQN